MLKNPVLAGFYPDPSICRAGRDFYLVTSSFAYAPGIPVFKSGDLEHWTQIGHVLDREEQLVLTEARMSEGSYAPCIRYHEGTFYVITTNVSGRTSADRVSARIPGSGNFYVTARNPKGPWSKPVYLEDAQGIDPSLFFDKDGRCYYVGQRTKKEARYFGDCEIWLRELDLREQRLTGETHVLWDGAMKNAYWPEGPHLYWRNGLYYLLTAEGGTGFTHSICVARSRSIYGPYEACPMNPVFTHRHLGRTAVIQNVGHADLVETEDGRFYTVMLGTRPQNGCAPMGRETFLAKVEWENDWPVIAPGEGMLRVNEEKSVSDSIVPCTAECIEWKEPLDNRCVFFRFPQEGMYEIKEAESKRSGSGRIALKALPRTFFDTGSPAYIGVRITSLHFSLETDMEFYPSPQEEAGLVYLYDERNQVRFVLTGSDADEKACVLRVVTVKEGEGRQVGAFSVKAAAHHLKLVLEGLTLFCIADGKQAGEGIDVSYLCSERAGGFTGCTAGIYAASECGQSEYEEWKDMDRGLNAKAYPWAYFTSLRIFTGCDAGG